MTELCNSGRHKHCIDAVEHSLSERPLPVLFVSDAVIVSPSKFAFEPLNLSNIRDTLIRLEESVSRGVGSRGVNCLSVSVGDVG